MRIDGYVGEVAMAVNNYQEKVSDLIEILDKINIEMNALDTCQYNQSVITQILSSIQKNIDQLFLNDYSNKLRFSENIPRQTEKVIGYSNLKNWMQELDSLVILIIINTFF